MHINETCYKTRRVSTRDFTVYILGNEISVALFFPLYQVHNLFFSNVELELISLVKRVGRLIEIALLLFDDLEQSKQM